VVALIRPVFSDKSLLLIRKISKEKSSTSCQLFEFIFLQEIQKYFLDFTIDYRDEVDNQIQTEQIYDYIVFIFVMFN
jgi:hypothetical protein